MGDPDPVVPAHDILVVLAEASGALRLWLVIWRDGDLRSEPDVHLSMHPAIQ